MEKIFIDIISYVTNKRASSNIITKYTSICDRFERENLNKVSVKVIFK